MRNSWSRILKSVYRKEPILSFAATAGAVNVAIGGLSEHWTLMAVGIGTVGVAIALRWWQVHTHRSPLEPVTSRAISPYVLPPAPDYAPLPTLTMSRKNPPQ
jgi:protein-S-isoprenylcysteine O-methyltransferase Ste14